MKWFAQASANIALIKYMGKADEAQNLAANSSISYTLNDLYTFCEVESHGGEEDFWEPLEMPGSVVPKEISEAAQQRYLAHLQYLKEYFELPNKGFIVRSVNNFDLSIGLASSASSFAALTKAAVRALCDILEIETIDDIAIAELSRRGSGSSCRSFCNPWAYWHRDGHVESLNSPFEKLIHHAIIVSHVPKSVSSSEAHRRVKTSPEYSQRIENAENRANEMIKALQQKDWRKMYDLSREDFLEMHQLFESSQPSFSYMTQDTHQIIKDIENYWDKNGDGPIVTVDAGPNVHLLFRQDQDDEAEIIKEKFLKDHDVI